MHIYESTYRKIQNIKRNFRSDKRFSFLDSLRKGSFLGYLQNGAQQISRSIHLAVLSILDGMIFLPLLVLPKHLAFTYYGVSDIDGTYARSYSSFLKRRDTNLASGSFLVLLLCFQILTTTTVTLSQPQATESISVCQDQGTCDYTTIQKAVNNADDGDIIMVAAGEYYENINLFGKKISVIAKEGAEATSIIGDGITSTITIPTRSDSPLLLRGFTITSKSSETSPMLGGGILISGDTTVITLEKCIIKNNSASLGGGVYSEGAHLIVKETIFETNSAITSENQGSGGGLYFENGLLVLNSSVFDRNHADAFGGGVTVFNGHNDSLISQSTFLYNETTHTEFGGGGGVFIENTNTTISASTFENNSSATHGGGLFAQGEKSSLTLGGESSSAANIFVDNTAEKNGGNIALSQMLAATILENTFRARAHERHAEFGAGIYADRIYKLHISDNIFSELQSESGAGVFLTQSSATLTNNLFTGQSVNSKGVALHVEKGSNTSLSLYHNVISQSRVFRDLGSAIFIDGTISTVRIFNNIIEQTYNGFGLYSTGYLNTEEIHHNDVWNNEKGNFSDAQLLENNISVDPLFVNRTQQDYHLQEYSLLIDQGHDEMYLTPDIDGNMRPNFGTAPDIGFDEVQTPYQDRPFYIDTQNGDDLMGQGTVSKPFRTIEQALSLQNSLPGKTFYVQGRIDTPIFLTQKHSGSSKRPFTISQWANEDNFIVSAYSHDYGFHLSQVDFVTLAGVEIIGADKAAISLENSDNITIQNSVITDNNQYGILAQASNTLLVLNNTFAHNPVHIELQESSISGNITNNIFSIGKDEVGISVLSDSTNLLSSDYNNFFLQSDSATTGTWTKAPLSSLEEWQTFSGHDKNSMNADPKFVDASSGNWKISSESSCIDAGNPNIDSPAYDKDGSPRPFIAAPKFIGHADMGAFEYQYTSPKITEIKNQISDSNILQIHISLSTNEDMEYAITHIGKETWAQEDGTLKDDPFWSDQTDWIINNPSINSTYDFRAIARNKKQSSYTSWSQKVAITTPTSEPQGLTTSNITVSGGSLSWNKSQDADIEYELHYGTDPLATNAEHISSLKTTSYQLSSLSEGTTYYWKIRTKNMYGVSVWSNPAVFTTLGEKPQNTVQVEEITAQLNTSTQETEDSGIFSLSSVRAQTDTSSAIITWKTNQAATSKIEYGISSSFGEEIEISDQDTKEHSIELTNLAQDTLYYFRVSSINEDDDTIISDLYTFTPSEIVKTPIIISPEMSFETLDQTPTITGLAQSGVTVKVYINGVLTGETYATTTPTGTGSFAYTPENELIPDEYYVQVLAENSVGIQSEITERRTFTVYSEYVTETLNLIRHQYEENPLNSTANVRPMFVGLGYPGSTVKIYIDNEVSQEFTLPENGSGIIDFSHRPTTSLDTGKHEAYYETYDSEGNITLRTSKLIFRVVEELPVPVVFSPSQGETTSAQPTITGIASADNTISVYVDDTLYGKTQTSSGKQGIGSFEYEIPDILKSGEHSITVRSEDSYHKKSAYSDVIIIVVE